MSDCEDPRDAARLSHRAALRYPYKVLLPSPFVDAALNPLVVVDGIPAGARTCWLTCSSPKATSKLTNQGCRIQVRLSRGLGDTDNVINLSLFQAVCIDVTGCLGCRIVVQGNQIAADANAKVTAVFSDEARQNNAPSQAWSTIIYGAGAPNQQVPSGAVQVMDITGADNAFQWGLTDATGAMIQWTEALVKGVPTTVKGTQFQPGGAETLAWLIQL